MNKGVVMEVNHRFVTVLTPDGEFIKMKKGNQPYAIGEEILFQNNHPSLIERFSNVLKNFLSKKILIGVPIALAIIFLTFIPIIQSNQVYAYISLDVNPSLELALNENLEVIDILTYNEKAELIKVELKNWKHKSFNQVANNIIEHIKQDGYFSDQQDIVIGTVVLKEENNEANKEKLNTMINEVKSNLQNESIQILEVKGTKEERKEAVQSGITIGKMKEQLKKQIHHNIDKVNKEKERINQAKQNNNEENIPSNKRNENGKNKDEKHPSNKKNENGKNKDENHPSNKKNENEKNKDENHPSNKKSENGKSKGENHPSNKRHENGKDKAQNSSHNKNNGKDKGKDHPSNNRFKNEKDHHSKFDGKVHGKSEDNYGLDNKNKNNKNEKNDKKQKHEEKRQQHKDNSKNHESKHHEKHKHKNED